MLDFRIQISFEMPHQTWVMAKAPIIYTTPMLVFPNVPYDVKTETPRTEEVLILLPKWFQALVMFLFI